MAAKLASSTSAKVRQQMSSAHLYGIAAVGIGLLVWEALAQGDFINRLIFPPPSETLNALADMLFSGQMIYNVGVSMRRLLFGFILGASPGFLLGLILSWSPTLRSAFDPLIAAAYPIPKIAILPLVLVLFGLGENSILVTIAISVFFPMLINTLAGVRQVDPLYIDVASHFKASRLALFTHVMIPASLNIVLAGVQIALNSALLITIASEIVLSKDGLGKIIWFGWQSFQVEDIYAGLVIISLLGIMINSGVRVVGNRLVHWQRHYQDIQH